MSSLLNGSRKIRLKVQFIEYAVESLCVLRFFEWKLLKTMKQEENRQVL
jgi:hypothetical protein